MLACLILKLTALRSGDRIFKWSVFDEAMKFGDYILQTTLYILSANITNGDR